MQFKINIPFSIGVILLFAFCIRIIPIIMMSALDVIPQEWSDESSFYNYARSYFALNSGADLTQSEINGLYQISSSREFSISYILSLAMYIFGDSLIFSRMIAMLFGLFSIFLVYRLTYEITSSSQLAKLSAIITTLFPTLIIYSSMFTREPFIIFFILFGLLLLFFYKKTSKFRYLIIYAGCVFIENYMHGGVAFSMAIIGIVYFGLSNQKSIYKVLLKLMILLIIFLFADFTYLENLQNLNFDFVFQEINKRSSGVLSYMPEINSIFSFISYLPSIILKFLIGFPVSTSYSAILIISVSLMWLILLMAIHILSPQLLVYSPKARLIYFSAVVFFIVFAIGSTNYGTALRHKTKFTPLLIILASSSIAITNKKYLHNI